MRHKQVAWHSAYSLIFRRNIVDFKIFSNREKVVFLRMNFVYKLNIIKCVLLQCVPITSAISKDYVKTKIIHTHKTS